MRTPQVKQRGRSCGTCERCLKAIYKTRRDARTAAKAQPDPECRAYKCPAGYWHFGHLPKAVIRGRMGRDSLRRDDAA
jgi:hypothetical protein